MDNFIEKLIEKNSQEMIKIDVLGMADLLDTNKVAFTLARKNGLGASDMSICLGINKWKTVADLVAEKSVLDITDAEMAVGELVNVRKGADLEPLILNKFRKQFSDKYKYEMYKPNAQYRFVDHKQLTVNFDGVLEIGDNMIPVEAKFVSKYAGKFWDKSKAIYDLMGGSSCMSGGDLLNHLSMQCKYYGIPDYYYTQLQLQLKALNADFGYMVALFEDTWEIFVFKIYADTFIQQEMVRTSELVWNKILQNR